MIDHLHCLGALSIVSPTQAPIVQQESQCWCLEAFEALPLSFPLDGGQESVTHPDPESLRFHKYLWKEPHFSKAFCYQALTIQPVVHISAEQTEILTWDLVNPLTPFQELNSK